MCVLCMMCMLCMECMLCAPQGVLLATCFDAAQLDAIRALEKQHVEVRAERHSFFYASPRGCLGALRRCGQRDTGRRGRCTIRVRSSAERRAQRAACCAASPKREPLQRSSAAATGWRKERETMLLAGAAVQREPMAGC